MHQIIQEYSDCRGETLAVQAEQGVIRGVKILGLESTNRRTYLRSALAEAVARYEGAKVNVDHPRHGAQGPRGYRDRLGVIRAARLEPQGIFADFHFNPKHPLAEQLVWDAEHAPHNVGFSHNVVALTSTRGGRTVVEAITHVHSVDLVADPATTHGLFEQSLSQTEGDEMDITQITLDQIKAQRPDLVEALLLEQSAGGGGEEAIRQGEELARLRQQVDRYQAAEALAARRSQIDELLVESRLPAEAVSEPFIEQLLAADEAGARRLIEDRQALVQGIAAREERSRPKSREPSAVGSATAPADAKSFAAALR